MWGQSWTNILDVTIPYPGKSFLDVTPEMLQQVKSNKQKTKYLSDFKANKSLENCRQMAVVSDNYNVKNL